eukprot:TRINITY_DN463_c0_g2_i3.p1 TRINITY_DN463_c0_g2~~TRINITY_DN463_c0_g2_i3.p1  ORF type:complete len:109 (-),score=46.78 TRINITY_DN463_c0_g2_i3:39-329(-)
MWDYFTYLCEAIFRCAQRHSRLIALVLDTVLVRQLKSFKEQELEQYMLQRFLVGHRPEYTNAFVRALINNKDGFHIIDRLHANRHLWSDLFMLLPR